MTLTSAFALPARAQTPPPPNPDKPVDYAAWLNERFAVPDERNAAAKYRQAVEALVPDEIGDRFYPLLYDGWNDEERTKAAAWVKRNEKPLELWREAAAMPACWFPHKSEPRLIPDAPFAEMRSLTKLGALSMWLNLEQGDSKAAVADLRAILGAARHMEGHPGGTTYLLALADRQAAYRALLRAVPSTESATAKELLAALRQGDPPPGRPDHMLLSTRLDHYHLNQRYAVDEDGDGVLDHVRHPEFNPVPFPDGLTWSGLVAELDKYITNCRGIVDQPHYPAATEYANTLDNPVLGEFALPGVGSSEIRPYDWPCQTHAQIAEVGAYRSAVRLVLACRVFRAEHGRWPRDLAEAAGDEPADIRLDRFSGKDLGYRLTADGPLVYSANQDGRDDGGKWPSLGAGPFRQWTDEPGDYILWPLDYDGD